MHVQQLCARFGLRQRVSARVISCPIGPVVVGCWRPMLLLPEAIFTGKSASQLEPLIAHELIHIRRGDLWWALLQTVATRLWWFHPLIQWAGRMVTCESERSCDEETVMSLDCSPSAYARALLDVLELKHQLQIAPALPGVRPVDVTLKRMERIMRLGQGSHQRSPRWVWGLLVIVGAMALPSAAVSLAQESQDGRSQVVAEAAPVPKVSGAIAEAFESYRCDVGDLLDLLQSQNFSPEEARQRLLEQIPIRKSADLSEVAARLGLPAELSISLPEPRIVDRELEVFELKAQVEAIKAALVHLRKAGFRQVDCGVHIFDVAPADYKAVADAWTGIQRQFVSDLTFKFAKGEGQSWAREFGKNDIGVVFVETEEGIKVAHGEWTESSSIAAKSPPGEYSDGIPAVMMVDAQGFESQKSNSRLICISAPQLTGASGQHVSLVMRKPTFGKESTATWEDTSIDLQPLVLDDKTVQISFELKIGHMSPDLQYGDNVSEKFIRCSLKENLTSGQTLVIGGIPIDVQGQQRMLVVCLTPTIGSFVRKPVEYEPIVKAIVLGFDHKLSILGPLLSWSGEAKDFDPPTDDELLQAIEGLRERVGDRPLPRDQTPRFSLKKIASETDPVRFIPLIGMAKLHHTIYECSLTRDAFPGVVETITVDHNHFELVSAKTPEIIR